MNKPVWPGRPQSSRLADLWRILAATSAITLVAMVVSFWLLYAAARDQQLDDMERAAETLAALMESVARFDAQFSAATHPQGSRGATLRQIEQGLAGYIGRRGGEELVLGQRAGSRVQVLRATPDRGLEMAAEFDYDGFQGRPLYEATEGRHGNGRFLDYRGVPVLAAYAPVPTLGLGIVYKIDASVFNAPFLRAGGWAGAIYFALVAALVTIYRRSTRRLSQSLDSSEARYRRLHESMTDAFVEVTMDGRIVGCNQAYREMLGYTDDELRRLTYVDLTPDRWHEFEARLVREQVLPRGASGVYEKEYRRKDGTVFPVELRTFLLPDAAGAPAAMWAIVRDITVRKKAELELAEKEAQLRAVVEGAFDGILMVDVETRKFSFGNPAICQMLGVTPQELLTLGMQDIHPPQALDELDRQFEAMGRGEVKTVRAAPLLRKDGEIRLVDISGGAILVGGRKFNVGVFRDITEQERSTRAIREQARLLDFIFKHSQDCMAVLDKDYNFVRVTDSYARAGAREASDFAGKNHFEMYPSDFKQEADDVSRSKLAYHKTERPFVYADHPEWGVTYWDIDFVPVLDDADEIELFLLTIKDVTVRRRQEEALKSERDRLRQILDSQFGFVTVMTPEGAVSEINATPLDLAGLSREAVLGKNFWEIGWIEPAFVPQVRADIAAAARGETVRRDLVALFPGLGARDVDAAFSPIRETDGRVSGVVGYGIDITERKQATTLLQRSEARLRAIIDASPVPMALNDEARRITYLNRSFTSTFGYDLQDIPTLADWWPKAYPEATYRQWVADSWQMELERVASNGTAFTPMEVAIRCKDGAERIALASAALVEGDVSIVALLDISNMKRAESSRRESEARLNEAQRIARVGSWELDLVSNHLHWSAEIFRLFELDPAQFGASYEAFLDAIHPDDRAAVNAAYTGSLRDRQPYRITHRLRMADGRVKHVEEQCETEFAPDGTPLRSRGTVQDVTERALAEERIRQSLLEKETLLREIHHRVKNNLQVVASLLHFHAKKLRDAASVEVFAEVRAQLRSMTLVHEKLYRSSDLARIDFGDYLRDLVPEIVNARAAKTSVAVSVGAADAWLPIETAMPCGLLVSELLTNALKHGFPDGRRGRVDVTSRLDAGALVLAVADDGVGLPEGFDPAATGTFGWQLVHGLAAQVGATVDVARERGTVVRVVVPLASEVPSS